MWEAVSDAPSDAHIARNPPSVLHVIISVPRVCQLMSYPALCASISYFLDPCPRSRAAARLFHPWLISGILVLSLCCK